MYFSYYSLDVTSIINTGIGCDPGPEETTRNTGYHGDYYALQLEVGSIYSKKRGMTSIEFALLRGSTTVRPLLLYLTRV